MTITHHKTDIPPEAENYLLCSREPCILEKLMYKRGQIASVTYQTELIPRKEFKEKYNNGKRVVFNRLMRVGIDYENRKNTIEKRENGIPPTGLRGYEWAAFPYLLKNKDNELYFRFYPFGNNEVKVKYYLGGDEYDWDNIKEFFLAKCAFSGCSEVVNIKVENILEVK